MILATLSTLRDVPAAGVAEGAEHPCRAHYIDFSEMNSAKILELFLKILTMLEQCVKFLTHATHEVLVDTSTTL